MKKIIIGIGAIAVIVLGLVLTGVLRNDRSEMKQDDAIVLSILAYEDLTDPIDKGNFDVLLEAFYQRHPGVTLELEFLFNEPYHTKLTTLAVADQLPDLMFLWPGKRTGQVTGSGRVKDIRTYVDGVRDEFAASALADQGPNGEIYELPEQVTATHVMYANNRLLDELGLTYPETFEELLAQGETIRNAGYIPIAMDNGDGWQMHSCLLSVLVERLVGSEDLLRMVSGELDFNDPRFVAAVDIIRQLDDAQMFSPGLNQASYGIALSDFVNGQAVYLIDGGWRTANLTAEMDEMLQKDVSYEVFPALPNEIGREGSTAIVAGTGYGMNAALGGTSADEAWNWIYFFAGGEGAAEIKFNQGTLPAMTSFELPANSPLMQRKLADFLGAVPGGFVLDAILDGEGMGILQPAIQEMMFDVKTAADVASEYETWVSTNDSGRN